MCNILVQYLQDSKKIFRYNVVKTNTDLYLSSTIKDKKGTDDMKKNFYIKKTVALIVVLVMLVAMIPAGMISAGAAPTISLDDYDTTDEYVIMNIEDWKLIASATDKDFMGITVKLGADIDAAGETEIIDPMHMGMVEIPEDELGPDQNPGDKYPMAPRPDGTPMSSDARHQALAAIRASSTLAFLMV